MSGPLDEELLVEIEARAVELAREAGRILTRHFGAPLEVEYKDEGRTDPVTAADLESQQYVTKAILEHYPDHGVVAEEDSEEGDSIAPDLVWVVDPLDGTKNFVGGLPVFACSIGVLYRGAPVVGAIYTPWPGEHDGVVMHARRGGGAFLEDSRLETLDAAEPAGNRLATLPGSFGGAFKMGKGMRGKVGDVRVTGSIAYELALVARGVVQYSVITGSRLWDVAAGVVLVMEAGGAVRVPRRGGGRWPLPGTGVRWDPLESFFPDWRSGETKLGELRQQTEPLVAGSPGIVRHVTESIARRRRWGRGLRRVLRRTRRS